MKFKYLDYHIIQVSREPEVEEQYQKFHFGESTRWFFEGLGEEGGVYETCIGPKADTDLRNLFGDDYKNGFVVNRDTARRGLEELYEYYTKTITKLYNANLSLDEFTDAEYREINDLRRLSNSLGGSLYVYDTDLGRLEPFNRWVSFCASLSDQYEEEGNRKFYVTGLFTYWEY